jgi:undecaprenyl-diphosphatase
MTTIFQAIILGIVQGITEWLPVSSSGHLVLMQHFFGLSEELALDLALHIASLFVVLVMFRTHIWSVTTGFYTALVRALKTRSWHPFHEKHAKMGLMVIIASVPTAIIGFGLRDIIEQAFSSVLVVAFGLLFTALLLWLTQMHVQKKEMGWKDSLFIGVLQGIAIFPGVSRSGSTISAGLLRGVDNDEAATFSFLLFIPAIIGATILEAPSLSVTAWTPVIVASLTAMAVSYFVIRWLLSIIRQGKLYYFSFYCLTVALLVIINYLR